MSGFGFSRDALRFFQMVGCGRIQDLQEVCLVCAFRGLVLPLHLLKSPVVSLQSPFSLDQPQHCLLSLLNLQMTQSSVCIEESINRVCPKMRQERRRKGSDLMDPGLAVGNSRSSHPFGILREPHTLRCLRYGAVDSLEILHTRELQ